MRKILSLAVALFSAMGLMASVNTLNYQAVINTPDGSPASEKEIGMCFSIVNGNDILFAEETVVKSSAEGLVEWQVGSTVSGGLSAIDWSVSGLMLQVGIDLNGGSDYSSVYSSTIQSVPVAMYAERSGDTNELLNLIYTLRADSQANIANLKDYVDYLDVRSNENSAMIGSLRSVDNDLMVSMVDLRERTEKLIDDFNRSENQIIAIQSFLEDRINEQRAYTDIRIEEVNAELRYLNALVSELENQIANLRENK